MERFRARTASSLPSGLHFKALNVAECSPIRLTPRRLCNPTCFQGELRPTMFQRQAQHAMADMTHSRPREEPEDLLAAMLLS